jgi:copper oxidase (laccase) domain-containing protein
MRWLWQLEAKHFKVMRHWFQTEKVFLSVTVADCTPILIYDPVKQAVGAVHAGWRGTVRQITAKALQKMQEEFGTRPENCFAYVGTCIDEKNFEVGIEVADEFKPDLKGLTTSAKNI